MAAYRTIKVQQLDADGNVWREFVHQRRPAEVETKLDQIDRAYNMARTRVLVDGLRVAGAANPPAPLAGLVAAFDAEAARMRATMGDQS